jgi:outer membrane autotransporter protein
MEFYKSQDMQMGAFLNFRLNGFTQAGNIAGAFTTKAGLYSKAQYDNLGADLEIGGLITQGISRREVFLDATYNPESIFHAYGASAKLGLDYMFSINKNQQVGPYLAMSWQLIKNSRIKEEGGKLGLQVPSQMLQTSEGLFGAEFRHDARKINLTARLFAGQNLTGRQKLNVEIGGERLSIASDDLSKMFFGAAVGAGFNISKNLIINTEAQVRANNKFNDYKGGLSVIYKLPYRK